ncbi:MAG: hypothetical protein J6R42_03495 [Clostridia bacterium]|nr:hypothetical protein [Clostridia bacterium]
MNKQDDQIPYGFGMALASRPDALLAFLSMPSLLREKFVTKAEHAKTEKEYCQVVEDVLRATPEVR